MGIDVFMSQTSLKKPINDSDILASFCSEDSSILFTLSFFNSSLVSNKEFAEGLKTCISSNINSFNEQNIFMIN